MLYFTNLLLQEHDIIIFQVGWYTSRCIVTTNMLRCRHIHTFQVRVSTAFAGSVASSDGVAAVISRVNLGEGYPVQLDPHPLPVSLKQHPVLHPEVGRLASSVQGTGECHVNLERSTGDSHM